MGVDQIVVGGQTMNASTSDFINAFEKISADYILVYPNNSNITLAFFNNGNKSGVLSKDFLASTK